MAAKKIDKDVLAAKVAELNKGKLPTETAATAPTLTVIEVEMPEVAQELQEEIVEETEIVEIDINQISTGDLIDAMIDRISNTGDAELPVKPKMAEFGDDDDAFFNAMAQYRAKAADIAKIKAEAYTNNLKGMVIPQIVEYLALTGNQAITVKADGSLHISPNATTIVLPGNVDKRKQEADIQYRDGENTWKGRAWTKHFLNLMKKEFPTWTEDRIVQSFSNDWKENNRTKEDHDAVRNAMEKYKV